MPDSSLIRRRLLPIATIVTPATLSVGFDFPPAEYLNVPFVDFTSLNLLAPMVGDASGFIDNSFSYQYTGPGLSVRRITDAVAAQGFIVPVVAPAVNSSWNMVFNGPSLHCSPVDSDFRREVLANVLDYTLNLTSPTGNTNCSIGPAYVAWHPAPMTPDQSMMEYLPFTVDASGLLGLNDNRFAGTEIASVFLLVASVLASSRTAEGDQFPAICDGMPWFKDELARYRDTSILLRCDLHNTTYDTSFSVINGAQTIHVNNATELTDSPLIALGRVAAYFNSSNQTDTSLQPHDCDPHPDSQYMAADCLFNPQILSTLSYQAVMDAFNDLITGLITPYEGYEMPTEVESTTRIS
ncbi:MAG: hypothetical protein Q9223_007934, partial [Gallowayella weberi]